MLNRIPMEQFRDGHVSAEMRAAFAEAKVLIWSAEHGSFWRGTGSGYTFNRVDAGHFTLAEALERTSHCGPEKRIQFERIPKAPVIHRLKCEQPGWTDIDAGRKTFDSRIDDRGFKVGDLLCLVAPDGRECWQRVDYIMPGGRFGIREWYVVMGLTPYRRVREAA